VQADQNNPYQNKGYRNYVLGLLTLVYAVNYVDRQILVILQESIKVDLSLSDTQLGLLTGLGFAFFYVFASIPIARLADRSNRRTIISISVGTWSLMTAFCGLAANFYHLLMARIGVAIGEAGCVPPSHSMISDMYPTKRRATAMSFYSIGINIGVMFGFLLGGIINEYFGWRAAFFVVGAPGLLIALIVRFTIKEPPRGAFDDEFEDQPSVNFGQVLRFIVARRFLVHLALGAGMISLAVYGLISWTASFFLRGYEISVSELSVWLAIAIGLFGAIGTFCWGYFADRLSNRDKRWYFWLPTVSTLMVVPSVVLMLMLSDLYIALTVYLFSNLFLTGYLGSSLAILHSTVEPHMRATASALLLLTVNIIGLACGPTLVGAISDALEPTLGVDSLRFALLIVVPIACIWSALHFILGSKAWRKSYPLN